MRIESINMCSFIAAIEFLTIIRIPGRRQREIEIEEIGKSSAYFPLVGFLLGVVLAGVHVAFSSLLPREIINALIVFLLVIFTGGIHLDGLADTVDGIWGGNNKDEKLQIMKSSGIGAFGATALFFSLLFKFLFLNAIPQSFIHIALVLMIVLSRWSMTLAAFIGRSARQEGLGSIFIGNTAYKQLIFASATALVIGTALLRTSAIVLILGIAGFTMLFVFFVSKQLDGITGDVLGTLAEISEILCLVLVFIYAWVV